MLVDLESDTMVTLPISAMRKEDPYSFMVPCPKVSNTAIVPHNDTLSVHQLDSLASGCTGFYLRLLAAVWHYERLDLTVSSSWCPSWCRAGAVLVPELASQQATEVLDSVLTRLSFRDKMLHVYTSGTTGLPKAAVRFFPPWRLGGRPPLQLPSRALPSQPHPPPPPSSLPPHQILPFQLIPLVAGVAGLSL